MFAKKTFAAKLIFVNGPFRGKSIALQPGRTLVIGRGVDADLAFDDDILSRKHCIVMATECGTRFFVEDLSSANGTFVNGARISERTELLEFDRLVFGGTEMELRYG